MAKHTELPWRLGRPGCVVCDTPISTPTGHDATSYYGGYMIAESIHKPEDAAFIVRACNAHYELLAACRNASDLLLRCDGEIRPNDLPHATDEDWDRIVEQLRDVIAKAEGTVPA